MRLYLAGCDVDGRIEVISGLEGLAILVSYWYIENGKGWKIVNFCIENEVSIFLDSGAFSAFNSGASIEVQDYIDFCREHGTKFDVIAALDVICDHNGTWENYDRMLQAGIDCIPTFHVREPFDFLERLAETSDYIALGVAGLQTQWSYRQKLFPWLIKCFQIIRNVDPVCRVHGFALTSWKVMWSFPWFSVDSTTWMNARFYGEVIVRHGHKLVRVGRGKPENLRKYGTRVRHLLPARTSNTKGYDAALRHNARTMLEWTQFVTQRK